MKKERIVNIVILGSCLLLYVFARIVRARYEGDNLIFLRYHFTDMLAPIVVLSYSGLLLNMMNHYSIKNFFQIVVLCAFCSFVWEYCARFLHPSSTSDWLDVVSIFGGGLIYWTIINLIAKEKNNG